MTRTPSRATIDAPKRPRPPRRAVRAGALTLATVGVAAAAVATASPAHADVSAPKKLVPGDKVCVQQYASYQVRGDGTATNQGAFFTIEYLGLVRANSATATTTAWAAELRSSWGTFPGPGTYKVCAYNFQSTNTNVTVRIRTDAEF